jgi:hypothetical protein
MASNFPTQTIQNMTETLKLTLKEELEKIATKHGKITAEIVLKHAENKNSPLHNYFQWEDTIAANEYRKIQAAGLIRRIKVQYHVTEDKCVTVRAWHNVQIETVIPHRNDENVTETEEHSAYVSLDQVMNSSKYRAQLLAQCKIDIGAFKRKYAALNEVASIIAAMDETEQVM